MIFTHPRLKVQCRDLMSVTAEELLEGDGPLVGGVDAVLADAQDLTRRTNKSAASGAVPSAGRNGSSGLGAGVACAVLGIWALTLQEVFLALSCLREGGSFVFRFGWRDRESRAEAWYREATQVLLGFVIAHFREVSHLKSEFSHQADASFYVVATGFLRDGCHAPGQLDALQEAIGRVVSCEKAPRMPKCLDKLAACATAERRAQVDAMLDTVSRLRAIGLATRKHLEVRSQATSECALIISPVPFHLTLQRLREELERYGKIAHIKRRAHPVGVGADAFVQFVQAAHAAYAEKAIAEMQILGPNISVRRTTGVGR
eukprot:TRINITY_DN27970_c0_g2_i2.p1 TRINITY_DN27970_c0_g2~~TRINITY_DN27970_c0_g2_i2.p1  ORF type:complete len:317 (+),score=58.56 TRINITY_DN27970_c0_g2_i2:108-1058(+)